MGEIYAKIFVAIYLYTLYMRAMAQTTRSRARMCLLGVKKFEINI